jgi:GTP:adenosylcobinamide-phosphate guanylyltransferase
MNAIVTAGGITRPDEPLYQMTGSGYKSMLSIAGKPMVQWVLDALNAARTVDEIYVVGLPHDPPLQSAKALHTLQDQGDMVNNILHGARNIASEHPAETYALIVSADIPAVTPEMVDWVANRVLEQDFELYYNVIQRATMETRFPGSRRTYVQLKDMQCCGGDLNAIRLSLAAAENPIWDRLIAARKSPLRQAALIGYDTLFLLLLRRLSLSEAERAVGKKLNVRVKALRCPFAEIGMDIDKPFQFEIVQADLSRRHG